jgi:hypothetical protein
VRDILISSKFEKCTYEPVAHVHYVCKCALIAF